MRFGLSLCVAKDAVTKAPVFSHERTHSYRSFGQFVGTSDHSWSIRNDLIGFGAGRIPAYSIARRQRDGDSEKAAAFFTLYSEQRPNHDHLLVAKDAVTKETWL